ncbi:baseplate J/gp47 family protein [Paraburkholderia sp. J67]|uniref:baseplate J/gp47 family protein n=1 Tax=Paraburkholderia sp. J67 TaxID=2805435 RepID=UPI002ABE34EF|nr:baseplate J/gp47 family protein [Paraburkholderia sp. J67]
MNGTTQASRGLAALSPDSAPVDARTLAQQLEFVQQVARLVSYVGLDGKPDGDWRPFFANDLSFLLARIVSFDGDQVLAGVRSAVHGEPQPRHRDHRLLLQLFGLFRQVSEWALGLKHIGTPLELGTSAGLTLERLIGQQLAPLCQMVAKRTAWGREWQTMRQRLLHPYPGDDQQYLNSLWSTPLQPDGTADAGSDLNTVIKSFVLGVEAALPAMRAHFADSLTKTFGHQPQSALMIAFLRLLRHAKDDANAITGKHLAFYYRDILQLHERSAVADRGFVSLRPTPASTGSLVPAGTCLSAGKLPDGQDLVYAVDSDLVVNQDTLGELKTVYAEQAPLPGLTYVPRLYAAPRANSEDGLGTPLTQPAQGWPSFGRDWSGNSRANPGGGSPLLDSAPLAQTGLLITSPMLLLRGGRRILRVRFQFDPKPASIPRSPLGLPAGAAAAEPRAFADVAQAYRDVLEQTYASFAGRSPGAMAQVAMTEACDVSITTAKGWQPVEQVTVRANLEQCWVELMLLLPAIFPAVEPGPPAPLEAGGASPWPRLKLMLKPAARVYPYAFVQQLLLTGITLRVAVTGLTPSGMTTTQGPADASAPFAPFGKWPIRGSYLELADAELASKPIVRAALQVDWFNLPKAPQDLASYYTGYAVPRLANNAFRAAFQVRRAGRWSEAGSSRPLFTATDDEKAGLHTPLRFAVSGVAGNVAPCALESIRMELAAPDGGFGQQLYPRLLAEASMNAALAISARALAEAQSKPVDALPVLPRQPEPPFVPLAKSVAIDYVASQQLPAQLAPDAVSDPVPCFYQLGPFGYAAAAPRGTLLLDGVLRAGQLYIGLRSVVPGQLISLLFGMGEAATPGLATGPDGPSSGLAPAAVDWYYLQDNQWQRFCRRDVRDGTAGFTQSGIVRLLTSGTQPSCDTTLLPAGLFWLAAAVDDPQMRARTTQVFTQAAAVTQVLNEARPEAGRALPAGSIKDFVRKPPGIQAVIQPLPTLGGQAAESPDKFRIRVSERLRHKQRALSAQDFEQIALDSFPALLQATCLRPGAERTSGYACARVPAGTVRLVVVPCPPLGSNHPPRPGVADRALVEIRKALLQKSAVTLSNLLVLSPAYEEIKVVLQVKLQDGLDAAYYLQALSDTIAAWLAPWRVDSAVPLAIGGGEQRMSDLYVFVADQASVAGVVSLKALHTYERDGVRAARWFGMDDVLMPSCPWGVLVSAPRHAIRADGERYGIGSMAIGEDLMLQPAPQPVAVSQLRAPPGRQYALRLPLGLLERQPDVFPSDTDD